MQAASRVLALAAAYAWLLCGLPPPVPATEITLHSLGPCEAECLELARNKIEIDPDNDTSAWLVEDMEIKKVDAEDYALSGFITLHANLDRPLKTYFTTKRCKSASDVSTCRRTSENKFPDTCRFLGINSRNSPFQSLEYLENFRRACPLKAGKYFLNQLPVNKICSSDGEHYVCLAVRSGTTSGCLQMNLSINGRGY